MNIKTGKTVLLCGTEPFIRTTLLALAFFLLCLPQLFSATNETDPFYSYYPKGVREYENGNYNASCRFFKGFLEKYPNAGRVNILFKDAFDKYQNVEINLSLGQEALNKKSYAESLAFLGNVLDLMPQNRKALSLVIECARGLNGSIKILDRPDKNGNEITERTLTQDEELTMHAALFDQGGTFISTVRALWSTTENADKPLSARMSDSCIYSPVASGVTVTVKAALSETLFGRTGPIRTLPGKIQSYKIALSADKKAEEIKSIRVRAGDEFTLYASGFDKEGAYAGAAPVSWQIRGFPRAGGLKYSASFTASLEKSGKGNILIEGKNGKRKTLDLEVTAGDPYYLQIDTKPDGKGREIFSMRVLTGHNYEFYSCAYDRFGNFAKNAPASWKTTPTLEPAQADDTAHFSFNPMIYYVNGYLEAESPGIQSDRTGILSVFRGKITGKSMKSLEANVEKQNNVVHFVKRNDTLSLIISQLFHLPYRWKDVSPYVYAVSDYNKLPDADLIFPQQPLFIPFVRITNTITRANLSTRIFNDQKKENMIVIFHTNAQVINKMNKLLLLDEYFIRTSNLDYLKAKYNFDFIR